LSNKELAALVGLAPSSCLLRVRALAQRGVIQGYHADVAFDALGIGLQALIAVRLVQTLSEKFDALFTFVQAQPEVLAAFHVSGAADILVHVAVRDVAHLHDFLCQRLAARREVDRCESSVIYRFWRSPRLPRYTGAHDGAPPPKRERRRKSATRVRSPSPDSGSRAGRRRP